MKAISLRKFRDSIPDHEEPVEVTRRDPQGNFQFLGYWTPYVTPAPGAQPRTVTEDTVTVTVDETDDVFEYRVITSPADVAKVVPAARPFTKAEQARRGRRKQGDAS